MKTLTLILALLLGGCFDAEGGPSATAVPVDQGSALFDSGGATSPDQGLDTSGPAPDTKKSDAGTSDEGESHDVLDTGMAPLDSGLDQDDPGQTDSAEPEPDLWVATDEAASDVAEPEPDLPLDEGTLEPDTHTEADLPPDEGPDTYVEPDPGPVDTGPDPCGDCVLEGDGATQCLGEAVQTCTETVSGCLFWVTSTCDDGDACTLDQCQAGQGCTYQDLTYLCEDDDACTTNACDPVDGCLIEDLACDDGNFCTDDSCDSATGCVFAPNTNACDDLNVCTEFDICSQGECTGVDAELDCDDDDPCTNDFCHPVYGCTNEVNPNCAWWTNPDGCPGNDGPLFADILAALPTEGETDRRRDRRDHVLVQLRCRAVDRGVPRP
jgi:hypothetical protein